MCRHHGESSVSQMELALNNIDGHDDVFPLSYIRAFFLPCADRTSCRLLPCLRTSLIYNLER